MSESVNVIQEAFCAHFMLHQNDAVQDRTLTLVLVENYRRQVHQFKKSHLEDFKVLELQKMSKL